MNNLTTQKQEKQLKNTDLAHSIYKHRMTRQLTLKETAKDICTPSYLSRIEKGYVNPSKEIKLALCSRLNINLSQPNVKSKPWLDNLLREINEHDLPQLQYRLSHLDGYLLYHQWFQSFIIHLILNRLTEAKEYLTLLKPNTSSFTTQEMTTYLFFSGLYYFKRNQLNKAYEFFEHVLTQPFSPQLIMALNYYYLGKVCTYKTQDVAAISAFQESRSLLTQQNNHHYSIKCELALANLYLKHHLFDTSKTLLLGVSQKLDQVDLFNQTPQLIYTWGNYYYQQHHYSYAESYYNKSIQLDFSFISPHFMLANLYLNNKDSSKRKEYYTRFQNLNIPMTKRHQLKWQFYTFLLQDKQGEFFRIFLEKEAIPFARNTGFKEDYVLYATHLTTYFEQIRKFKKAHTTFKSIHPHLSCSLND